MDDRISPWVPSPEETERIFLWCLNEAAGAFGPLEPGKRYTLRLRAENVGGPETICLGDQVIICLTEGRNALGFHFEAGHEAVHCLNPRPGRTATYLEEAVATAFSLDVVDRTFGAEGVVQCRVPRNYRVARDLAATVDQDIIRLGKRLRERCGSLGNVTHEAFAELYPGSADSTVDFLLTRFPG